MAHRTDQHDPQDSPRTATQTTGFRIMRETEIAPGWFATAREVGETFSATVADTFCTAQNKVTMDPNRTKRIMYFAEPIAPVATA